MMKGEGGRGSWLRRDKSVASPLWAVAGTTAVARRHQSGLKGWAGRSRSLTTADGFCTLLGRNFVPGWETRRPWLGNGSSLLGNFLYLLGKLGLVRWRVWCGALEF